MEIFIVEKNTWEFNLINMYLDNILLQKFAIIFNIDYIPKYILLRKD